MSSIVLRMSFVLIKRNKIHTLIYFRFLYYKPRYVARYKTIAKFMDEVTYDIDKKSLGTLKTFM